MEYLEIVSAIIAIYASTIPLYIAIKVFNRNKRFFTITFLLYLGLFSHGLYHLMSNGALRTGFELVASSSVFALSFFYFWLRRKEDHD